jgi:UDP-3-O-[3-hydroxymyristoyl] glucosamine N-acyltransferase LpxD
MSKVINENGMISSETCAEFLDKKLMGDNILIRRVASLSAKCFGALKFVTVFKKSCLDSLNLEVGNFVVAHADYKNKLTIPHIISACPRLDFCKLANKYFPTNPVSKIEESANIASNVEVGDNTYVGYNTVIENGVKIGSNSHILHNVVISENCEIGSHCFIKSGTVIGQRGFGFERDADGVPVSFPHYGSVKIGNHVEIGALNTIVAGGLSDTIIESHVKTDDHVHIAHNVRIGWGTFIAACAEISGSVCIGEKAWIGPNSAVIDKSSIGNKSFIGIGAVITKSVSDSVVVAGNPGRVLKKIKDDK